MRIAAIILAVFISFLAVKPGVDMLCSVLIDMEIACCDTACTPISDKDTTKSPDRDNDCNGQSCNPFQVCNSCVLLVSKVTSIDQLFNPKPSSESSFTYQVSITSSYISDFWQPPKFV